MRQFQSPVGLGNGPEPFLLLSAFFTAKTEEEEFYCEVA
jgi:hypothetical protein